jgi:hypothetical protein
LSFSRGANDGFPTAGASNRKAQRGFTPHKQDLLFMKLLRTKHKTTTTTAPTSHSKTTA